MLGLNGTLTIIAQFDEIKYVLYGIFNTIFIIFEGASCIKRKIFASKKIIFTIKTIRSGV